MDGTADASVLEQLRSIEARLLIRLGELAPAVEEYHELRRYAERLGVDTSSLRAGPDAATATVAARAGAGGTQATGAERRQRVISLVGAQPGITVPQLSAKLGVEPPPLYRVVRRLIAEGVLVKRGMHLHLV